MSTLFGLLAAVSYGVSDFFGGLLTRRNPALLVVMWSQLGSLVLLLAAMPWLPGESLSLDGVLFGAAAGALGSVGLIALYQGLATARISVVAPTAALVGAFLATAVGLLLDGDRPSLLTWLGVATAVPAVFLISGRTSGDGAKGGGLRIGMLAGACFGLFAVLITRVPAGSEASLLVSVRGASVLVLVTIAIIRSEGFRLARTSYVPATLVGAGDMAGNVFFMLAASTGMLTIAGVIEALYPAVTVLLARVLLKERLLPGQPVGLLLAATGVALMAAG